MKFTALKPFYYLPEKKNYAIGDTIELSKEGAEAMLKDGFLSNKKLGVNAEEAMNNLSKGVKAGGKDFSEIIDTKEGEVELNTK